MSLNSELGTAPLTLRSGMSTAGEALPLEQRLPSFIGLDCDAVRAVGELSLVVVGLGSVGTRVADHVARLAPRKMILVDPAPFKLQSLVTHPISRADVGRAKAELAAESVKSLSPQTEVLSYQGRIQELDPFQFRNAGAVLLCTDNHAAEVEASEVSRGLGLPLYQGSVYGEALVAQLKVITNRSDEGPCLACGYTRQDWAAFHRRRRYSCSGDEHAEPTMSLSPLCGIAADLLATELVRSALHLGPPAEDTVVEYCGYTHQMTRTIRQAKAGCPASHRRWEFFPTSKPLAECVLAELPQLAGISGRTTPIGFHLAGHRFVELAVCCGVHHIRRFAPHGVPVGQCRKCSRPLLPGQVFSKSLVEASHLKPLDQLTLQELGAAQVGYVMLQSCDRTVVIYKGC